MFTGKARKTNESLSFYCSLKTFLNAYVFIHLGGRLTNAIADIGLELGKNMGFE